MKDQEQTLLDFYRSLSEQDAQALLRFAEFLASGAAPAEPGLQAPVEAPSNDEIPKPTLRERPENEKVVDALKRLSASYPMLEKKKLLDKASALVTQHVMFKHPAELVINQLEDMFKKAYEQFIEEDKG